MRRTHWARVRKAGRGQTALGAYALYASQGLRYLLPLILIPFLTRTMGTGTWGTVVFAQSFAGLAGGFIEYGFLLWGIREAAALRGHPERLSSMLRDVVLARLLLGTLVVGALVAVHAVLPRVGVTIFIDSPRLFSATLAAALAQGLSMTWVLIGLERARSVALVEAGTGLAMTVGVIYFVDMSAHAWRVLAVQAVVTGGVAFCIGVWAWYHLPAAPWSPRRALGRLREGFSLFVPRIATGFYTVGNAFLLGLYAVPLQVAWYAGAERVTGAVARLGEPLTRVLLPRVVRHRAQTESDAVLSEADLSTDLGTARGDGSAEVVAARPGASSGRAANWRETIAQARAQAPGDPLVVNTPAMQRLFYLMLSLMSAGALAAALAVWIAAPLAVRVLLGPGEEAAIPILRLLGMGLVPIFLSRVLGLQWMIPLRLDRAFAAIIVGAAVLNVSLLSILVPERGGFGMAISVFVTEVAVVMAMAAYLKATHRWPRFPERFSEIFDEPTALTTTRPVDTPAGEPRRGGPRLADPPLR